MSLALLALFGFALAGLSKSNAASRVVDEAKERERFSDEPTPEDQKSDEERLADREAISAIADAQDDEKASALDELQAAQSAVVDHESQSNVPTLDTDTSTKKPKKPKKKVKSTPKELKPPLRLDSAQSTVPISDPSQIPAGYDPIGARKMAPSIARNLGKGRDHYDRRLLRDFQIKAGITPDKLYGGQTRGALIHYGIPNPPQPFTAPRNTIRYVPPA